MPPVAIRLFGAPSIQVGDHFLTQFHSSRAAALLYYLAATNRAHSRDSLAALLWGEWNDTQAKTNLRSALYYLPAEIKPLLEITRSAVMLRLSTDDPVDVVKFSASMRVAEEPSLDRAERMLRLTDAVDLYQGEFLQGFHIADAETFDEWVRGEREHYHLLAIRAHGELVAHFSERFEYLQAINHATRLLKLEPLHEETYRTLMLLFAQSGQQSAALEVFQTCRKRLDVELGVEPDEETTELYERVLAGDLTPRIRSLVPAARSQPRQNLPAELTALVGRDQAISEVRRLLLASTTRLVTITGMGGAGKTRLAIAVARSFVDTWNKGGTATHFGDGVVFVNLAPGISAVAPDEVLAGQIAHALDLPLSDNIAPALQLRRMLAGKDLLLVLDNFEQLVAAAPMLTELLASVPSVKTLVTSRLRLNVPGEHNYSLVGLAIPAEGAARHALPDLELLRHFGATQLFLQAASAASPQFEPDDAARHAIIRICRMLDGIPLAIELAASWTRMLSCTEIVEELHAGAEFLEVDHDGPAAHRRSLRAAFDGSWKLLAPRRQQALRRLAVFRGGCTRNAAMAVAGASLADLAALTDHSLLRVQAGDSRGSVRYELLEVLRQYAAEQMVAAGEDAATELQHMAFYLEWLGGQVAPLLGGGQVEAVIAIDADIENVRAAVRCQLRQIDDNIWPAVEPLWHALAALFHFHDMRSWFLEGEAIFRQAAESVGRWAARTRAEREVVALEAKLTARRAWFLFHLGEYPQSEQLLRDSLFVLVNAGADAAATFNLNYLGALYRHLGRTDEAQAALDQAAQIAEAYGDDYALGTTYNIMGQVALLLGDLPGARSAIRRGLALKRKVGDQWGMSYALSYLGRIAQLERNDAEARDLYTESMSIYRSIGDQRGIAITSRNLGDVAYRRGAYADAGALYRDSYAILRDIGARMESSLALCRLGEVALAMDEGETAARNFFDALRLARSVRSRQAMLAALLGLAAYYVEQGEYAQAARLLDAVRLHEETHPEQRTRAAQLASLLPPVRRDPALAQPQSLELLADDLLINHAPVGR